MLNFPNCAMLHLVRGKKHTYFEKLTDAVANPQDREVKVDEEGCHDGGLKSMRNKMRNSGSGGKKTLDV